MTIIAILLYLLGMVYAHQFIELVAISHEETHENPSLFVKILLCAAWPIQAAVLIIGLIWESIIEAITRE